jgi:hypothetical protein
MSWQCSSVLNQRLSGYLSRQVLKNRTNIGIAKKQQTEEQKEKDKSEAGLAHEIFTTKVLSL